MEMEGWKQNKKHITVRRDGLYLQVIRVASFKRKIYSEKGFSEMPKRTTY